jgi:hypothetical protein
VWTRDAQDQTDKGDPTFTLKQTLILATSIDDFEFITRTNCSGTTEAKYVWDASEVETLPTTVEAGVTWQIAGVSRDDNTGLFTYYVLKNTANMIHVQYEAAETLFETVVKDKWKNLMPADFDPSMAGVPTPGTLVEVDAEKNEDCTLDVIKSTTVAAPRLGVSRSTSDDLYKESSMVGNVAQPSALPAAPHAAAGLVITHKSQQRKDLLWDQDIGRVQEHQVSDAEVTRTVGVKEIVEEVTDIASAPLPTPADTDIGVTVKNERTAGKFFKRTIRRILQVLRDKIAEVFGEDLFKAVYSKTSLEATEATDPGFSGGGVSKNTESVLTDSGRWAVTRKKETEKEVPEVAVDKSATIQGMIVEEVSIAATPLPYPSVDDIGQKVTNEKTGGGFFKRTLRYLVKILIPQIGLRYTEDQFTDSEEIENTEPARPADDTGFTPGEIRVTDASIMESGAFRVKRGVVKSKPVLDAGVLVEEDVFSRTVSDLGEHQNSLPSAAFASNSITSIGQWARNQFGRYGFRKVVAVPKNASQPELKTEDTALGQKYESAEWNRNGLPPPSTILNEGTLAAEIRMIDAKLNKFGLFDTIMSRILPKEKVYTYEFQVGSHYFWYSFFKNITGAKLNLLLAQANAKAATLIDSSVSPSLSHNAFGLIDGYVAVLYKSEDSRLDDSGYTIFSLHGSVDGPWIYGKRERDAGTGNLVQRRLRNKYLTYHQQGPDYAHGLQDFYNSMGAAPDMAMGSWFHRLGKNWYEFYKVYGVQPGTWEEIT